MTNLSNLIVPASSNSAVVVNKVQTLTGTGTVVTPIFGLTGTIEVLRQWLVVTTVISANHTAAFYRLNDQTAQPAITLATGIVLSGLAAGTSAHRLGLAAAALTLNSNAAGTIKEAAAAGTGMFSPYILQKKTAATTNIEYDFTTTDNPCTGVIQHFVEYRPLSADGVLTAL